MRVALEICTAYAQMCFACYRAGDSKGDGSVQGKQMFVFAVHCDGKSTPGSLNLTLVFFELRNMIFGVTETEKFLLYLTRHVGSPRAS